MILHVALLASLIPMCIGVKGVELRAPLAVRAGGLLTLECRYDLESALLYSIKFYLGDQEFYRFVPKETPPSRVFPLPGVQVDVSSNHLLQIFRSNSTFVSLEKVDKELSGTYKCEVSADAPLFHTVIKTANVIVTEEPLGLPEVTVEKGKYSLGEKIRANCTSHGGHPPANLTWFINGRQIKDKVGRWLSEKRLGLTEIEVEAVSSLFKEGRMRLRCLATQFTLYRQSAEVDLQEDTPQLAHVMGPTPPPQQSTGGEISEPIQGGSSSDVTLSSLCLTSATPLLAALLLIHR